MPPDQEFRPWNQTVIDEFRANHGAACQPDFAILPRQHQA